MSDSDQKKGGGFGTFCKRLVIVAVLLAAVAIAAWVIYEYGFNKDSKKDPLRSCTERAGVVYNGSCYLSPNNNRTWAAAETSCDNLGGHLVSMFDAAENSFAVNLVTQARTATAFVWTGLNDIAVPFSFVYTDGTTVGYTNWDVNKPSNPRAARNCVGLTTSVSIRGRWNDQGCDTINHYVCKFSIPSRPSQPNTPVAAVRVNRRVDITCAAPAFTGGANIGIYTFDLFDQSAPTVVASSQNASTCATSFLNLSARKSYKVRVKALNAVGSSAYSDQSAVFVPLAAVPGVPRNVTARASTDAVTVTWAPPADDGTSTVISYSVRTVGGGVDRAGINGSLGSVTFTKLGGTYRFEVLAINAIGSSAPSAQSQTVTVEAASPRLGKVLNVMASVPLPRSANLTWDSLAGATNYTVISSFDGILPVSGITTTSAYIPNLTNGQAFAFAVFGVNAGGDGLLSEFSNFVIPTAGPPSAPTGVTIAAAVQAVKVDWVAPADNGGESLVKYIVTATSTPGGVVTVQNTTGTELTLNVLGLVVGTAYNATVQAVNAADLIGAAGVAPGTAEPIAGAPSAPTNVVATGGAVSINVSWGLPVNTGGSPITGYVINCTGLASQSTGVVSSFVFTDVPITVQRNCTVQAVNGLGTGPAATSNQAASFASLPQAIASVVATQMGQGCNLSFTLSSSLSFRGGLALVNVQGYAYLLETDNVTRADVAPTTKEITAPNAGVPSFIEVTKLLVGRKYDCVVAASNSLGYGPASTVQKVDPLPNPPGDPTSPLATAADKSASVSWKAPAENGGIELLRYRVFYYRVNQALPDGNVTTKSGTDRTVSVTGLRNNIIYQFTVRAENAAGVSAESPKSNAVKPSDGSVFNKAAVIGGVIGAIVFLVMCLVGIMWYSESGCFKPDTSQNVYKDDSSANLTLQPTMSVGPSSELTSASSK